MKKIGTLSSAIGFIFLGIWMIIRQSNSALGAEVFKWWPIIIIILGCEVLIGFNRKEEYQRVKLSGLIIPVILVFIAVNIVTEVKIKVSDGVELLKKSESIDKIIDKLSDFNYENYKTIEAKKVISMEGKEFVFDANNSDITIRNSNSEKISIDAIVYVKKEADQNNYEIIEKKEANGYKVVMDESYIKKAKVVLYIPQNVDVTIKGNNSKIVSDESRIASSFKIEVNNASVNIKDVFSVKVKVNNAKIDLKDIQNVDISSNNATVNLNGKVPNINIDITNGVINVDNEVCDNVNIKTNSGTVKVNTKHKDIDVKLELNHGTSKINDDRRINSGQSKIFGDGSGKLKIDINNGLISFTN